tara:strand:- start:1797 stop:2051 length:255 start_codon:yes stop_codon:yes gene_type:complete
VVAGKISVVDDKVTLINQNTVFKAGVDLEIKRASRGNLDLGGNHRPVMRCINVSDLFEISRNKSDLTIVYGSHLGGVRGKVCRL